MKLRERERQSISDFLQEHSDKLSGRVLDLGCGLEPYRKIVRDAGGTYTGHDGKNFPGSVVSENIGPSWSQISTRRYDTVMMTQVWQYMEPHVLESLLCDLASGVALKPGGYLLATGPTNWPHIEPDDLWRFTTSGVVQLLHRAGFTSSTVGGRLSIRAESVMWTLGWEAVAQSPA